ncbi:hypothetical protein [Algiphilus sp.]|uniref:hypothetical protein n=1 Tax=Algiphilus sp. TaxID=1872431 RepID=UPI0025BD9A78|nr:hypothetical protein [Algiphilus sp.]MCK5770899.1 hypothetical protein [Algiphilus sp.]
MSYMHPNTERYPVTPFAHAGDLYWCQLVEHNTGDLRIGPLGEDRPADDADGLRHAALRAQLEAGQTRET